MVNMQLHDVFYIYLILYHSAEFMFVPMQLAFSYTVLLCLHSKKRETVTFYMSICPSVHPSQTHRAVDNDKQVTPIYFRSEVKVNLTFNVNNLVLT